MLYLVATPIGNIKEITLRAIETLKSVEVIAAEDTRRTAILLKEYEINKPLICYQKFNERACAVKIIDLLKQGKDIALVSDAGVPLISDPGAVLTRELALNGLEFTLVGCPCACISALVLSDLDASMFTMLGFLPEKKCERDKLLRSCATTEGTLVFYSSVHNIDDDLKSLRDAFGNRKVSVVREISKMFEQVVRGRLNDNLDFVRKGEFVIVVEGGKKDFTRLSVIEHYESYIRQGLDKKDAIKRVASDRGVAKSEIYNEIVNCEQTTN